MWLYGVFDWFSRNPAAQWAAGIGAALAAFWGWMTLRDRRIQKEARKEGRQQVIEEVKEQTDERVEDAREAARSTDDLNAAELRQLRARDPNNRSRLP